MHERLPLPLATAFAVLIGATPSLAQDDPPSIGGRVVDAAGEPLAGARVIIATASVRRGTSPY